MSIVACIESPILKEYDIEPLLFAYQRFQILLTPPKPDAPRTTRFDHGEITNDGKFRSA